MLYLCYFADFCLKIDENSNKSQKKCYNFFMKSLQLSRPHAIMMVGVPGSGKSFFARQFADMFGSPFIDTLEIEKRTSSAEAASELIGMMIVEIAKLNHTFVFEGNSDSRVRRTEFAQWARQHGYQPLFVWVQVDKATALKRTLKSKSLSRDEFESVSKQFSAPHPSEKAIVISGKHTYSSQMKVVLAHLAKDARPETQRVTAPSRPQNGRITVR
jgi:adenylate kinase family enzyme